MGQGHSLLILGLIRKGCFVAIKAKNVLSLQIREDIFLKKDTGNFVQRLGVFQN